MMQNGVGRLRWYLIVFLIGISLFTAAPSLDAPLIAEDSSILAYVHGSGPFADLARPQYDLHTAIFWRPLVTLSWWVEERVFGTEPALLRIFNIACHAASTLLMALVALRLGWSTFTALVAGSLVAVCPFQGGTVTWLAGRTDELVGALMLATAWLFLGGRRWLTALAALAACATKEFAFLLPPMLALLAWAQRGSLRSLTRELAPATSAVALAFAWRWYALGGVGGYATLPEGLSIVALPRALGAWLEADIVSSIVLGAALTAFFLGGVFRDAASRRGVLAGAGWILLGLAPLAPLLADGVLEEQNERLLLVADLGLVLLVSAGIGRLREHRGWPGCGTTLVPLAILARGLVASLDVDGWANAAELAQEIEDRARALVDQEPPSTLPVLFEGFVPTSDGAYCMNFGAADRFAPPFDTTPRPIWPDWPLFGRVESERQHPAGRGGELLRPEDVDRSRVQILEVRVDAAPLLVDRRVADEPDRSPRLVLEVAPGLEGATLECIVFTKQGYEPAAWPTPLGGVDLELSLRQVLLLQGPVTTLAAALYQAADLGATNAYLELRILREGQVVASSEWIELAFERALLDQVRPF